MAGGNKWLRPDDKEGALGRQAANALLESGEAMLHLLGNQGAGFGDAEHVSQGLYGRDDVRDGVRVSGVGGNPQLVERLRRFEAIERFGDENEIGM